MKLFLQVLFSILLQASESKFAVVTLVTSNEDGGSATGAAVLGQSLLENGSNYPRVALVTENVNNVVRNRLSTLWELIEIHAITCPNYFNLSYATDTKFDSTDYDRKFTCTKIALFSLSQYEKIIYMEWNTIAINSIDDALHGFSNASLIAPPLSFPPDKYNDAFLVLKPSKETFKMLVSSLKKLETKEKKKIPYRNFNEFLNNNLCLHWFTAEADDPHCGRLPWIFAIEDSKYGEYHTLTLAADQRPPSVIQFVTTPSPWEVLQRDYNNLSPLEESVDMDVLGRGFSHLYWRHLYFLAYPQIPPPIRSIFDILSRSKQSNSHTTFTSIEGFHDDDDNNENLILMDDTLEENISNVANDDDNNNNVSSNSIHSNKNKKKTFKNNKNKKNQKKVKTEKSKKISKNKRRNKDNNDDQTDSRYSYIAYSNSKI